MGAELELWEGPPALNQEALRAAKDLRFDHPKLGLGQRLGEAASELIARRVGHPEALNELFELSLQRYEPDLLPDVAKAAPVLSDAIEAGRRILIFGDYDVDGTTSAAVLTLFLRACGHHSVSTQLPHRMKDGYGIRADRVEAIAQRTDLLITVDCGATAFEALERAADLGLEVIVCDHHTVADKVPPARAVINPKRADNRYPGGEPAAVGVAFNLVIATRRELRRRGYFGDAGAPRLDALLELVALGTVADMVPLTGANRIFTRMGLESLQNSKLLGLRALAQYCKAEHITERELGFDFGPRINAAGRLDSADPAFNLLVAQEEAEAQKLAEHLNDLNLKRRTIQKQIVEEAVRIVTDWSELPPCIILRNEAWHPGVVGIVASTLVRRFHRCAVVIGEAGKGSARAVDGQNIFEALKSAENLLDRFGGHAAAAGLQFVGDDDDFRALRQAVCQHLRLTLGDRLYQRVRRYDLKLHPKYANTNLAWELAALGPWGQGNQRPIFMASDLVVMDTKPGKSGYLAIRVEAPDGGQPVSLFGFQLDDLRQFADSGGSIDVLYEIALDTFRGVTRARRRILAWRRTSREESIAEPDFDPVGQHRF